MVTSADNSKGTEFLSSVKARSFLDSGLSDVINAWVLPSGAVIAVNFQVMNSTQEDSHEESGYKITSNFYLRYIDQAPVYVKKIILPGLFVYLKETDKLMEIYYFTGLTQQVTYKNWIAKGMLEKRET